MRLFNKKAQSTAEYAIVIALVIGAAVAMQVYVRRGFQKGIQFSTDQLTDIKGFESNPFSKQNTGQYEPYYMKSETDTTVSDVNSSEEFKSGGEVVRTTGDTGTGEKTERASRTGYRGTANKD